MIKINYGPIGDLVLEGLRVEPGRAGAVPGVTCPHCGSTRLRPHRGGGQSGDCTVVGCGWVDCGTCHARTRLSDGQHWHSTHPRIAQLCAAMRR